MSVSISGFPTPLSSVCTWYTTPRYLTSVLNPVITARVFSDEIVGSARDACQATAGAEGIMASPHGASRLGRPRGLSPVHRLVRPVVGPREPAPRRLLPGLAPDEVVGHRPLRDGDSDQRDHVHRHHRPGLHGRDALPRLLLWPALRDGHPVPDARAPLLPR